MRRKRYNILHLLKGFTRDVPLFLNSIRGTGSEKFNHTICYIHENQGFQNTLSDLGYEVIYLGFKKSSTKHINPYVAIKLSRVLKEKDIDIIHCQKHKPTVYGALASLAKKDISVISHVHGLDRTRTLFRKITNSLLANRVSKFIGVSDAVSKDIIKSNWSIDPSKVITIRNGIDFNTIDKVSVSRQEVRAGLGLSQDDIVFGTVGRLAKTKGHIYLIDAFSNVIKKVPRSKLIIIGDGHLYNELKEEVEKLRISPYVLFLGFRNNVFELLRAFDIFVMPSIAEGLALALLEAMASRLPTIASAVGGIPEVFGNEKIGKLIPSKNVAALEAAMMEISSLDRKMKMSLGETARKRVEDEFSIDLMCRKLISLYESLLK